MYWIVSVVVLIFEFSGFAFNRTYAVF